MYATVEGPLDAAVVRRIFSDEQRELLRVDALGGRSVVEARIPKLREAARRVGWFVLVDLDNDNCAPELRADWGIEADDPLNFRVAIREIESWILADRDRLAKYMSVSRDRIPTDPDALGDPKATLISIARHSRKREIREGLVPRPGSGRSQGPLYTNLLSRFVTTEWRPAVARMASPSLDRCLATFVA
jgi:hypothetical protein